MNEGPAALSEASPGGAPADTTEDARARQRAVVT
jgi:hypothetical protein